MAVEDVPGGTFDAPTFPSPAAIARAGADTRTRSDFEAIRDAPTTLARCARCGWADDEPRPLRAARRAFAEHVCTAGPMPATRPGSHDERVAKLLDLVRSGMSGVKASEATGIPLRTAHRLIRQARDAGALPPA